MHGVKDRQVRASIWVTTISTRLSEISLLGKITNDRSDQAWTRSSDE